MGRERLENHVMKMLKVMVWMVLTAVNCLSYVTGYGNQRGSTSNFGAEQGKGGGRVLVLRLRLVSSDCTSL